MDKFSQKFDVVFEGKGYTPLERIALATAGNLQKTISAYYNSAVTLTILRFDRTGHNTFVREVLLHCQNHVFCNARSHLTVTSPKILSLLVDQKMGLGQMFAYLGTSPQFELLSHGKDSERLWRTYVLTIPEAMEVTITEVLPINVFDLKCDEPDLFNENSWNVVEHPKESRLESLEPTYQSALSVSRRTESTA